MKRLPLRAFRVTKNRSTYSGAVTFRHTYSLKPHPFPGKGPSVDMHKISCLARSCQLHFAAQVRWWTWCAISFTN